MTTLVIKNVTFMAEGVRRFVEKRAFAAVEISTILLKIKTAHSLLFYPFRDIKMNTFAFKKVGHSVKRLLSSNKTFFRTWEN